MRSIEDYAEVVAENMGLSLKVNVLGYAIDEKNNIAMSYQKRKFDKHIRFYDVNGKTNQPFLYLQEDVIQKTIVMTLVNRDNEKNESVRIVSFGGHDFVIYKDIRIYQEKRPRYCFYLHDMSFIIKENDDVKKIIPINEFSVSDIVNEMCDVIVNSYDSENWNEKMNDMLGYIKPAMSMLVSETEEIINRGLNRQEEKQSIGSSK